MIEKVFDYIIFDAVSYEISFEKKSIMIGKVFEIEIPSLLYLFEKGIS